MPFRKSLEYNIPTSQERETTSKMLMLNLFRGIPQTLYSNRYESNRIYENPIVWEGSLGN